MHQISLSFRKRSQLVILPLAFATLAVMITRCLAVPYAPAAGSRTSTANYGNGIAHGQDAGLHLAQYQAAVLQQPQSAKAHNNLGNAWLSLGQPEKAFPEYTTAASLDPHFANPYRNIGHLLYCQGSFSDAVKVFLHALQIQPRYTLAHYDLGLAYQAEAKPSLALQQYREAAKEQPDYYAAHINIGVLLSECGNHLGAIAQFQRAHAIVPNDATRFCNLGNEYYALGKTALARQVYSQAAKMDPDNPLPPCYLAMLYIDDKQMAKAIPILRGVLAKVPDYGYAHLQLGNALYRSGKIAEGRQEWAAAAASDDADSVERAEANLANCH